MMDGSGRVPPKMVIVIPIVTILKLWDRLLVGSGHGPLCTSLPAPPARRADWVGRTSGSALLTLPMMDVSSLARQEGSLAGHVPEALLRSCLWALSNRAI